MREDLLGAARTAIESCLRLRPEESCLILTDPTRDNIGRALFEAASAVSERAFYLVMPPGRRDGAEPPEAVATLMADMDVIVAATAVSITHTSARRRACAAGARIATMPGIRETTLMRCMGEDVDVEATGRRTEQVRDILATGQEVRVRTAAGTDLRLSIDGVQPYASTGLIHERGTCDNLPSGEAYLRPKTGSANGRVVIDGSMAGIGELGAVGPITLVVEASRVVRISDGDMAEVLRERLDEVGEGAYNLAEFGVGTNDAARIVGTVLEDEKVLGTIHIALGNDLALGGEVDVPLHLDGVILAPTVEIDGKLLLKEGVLQL